MNAFVLLAVLTLGFESEKPAQGWSVPKGWSVQEGVGRNGSRALVYENDDPTRYTFPMYRTRFEPGMVYRFGAWVKVDSIKEKTPRVGLDWSDKDGKWLGGCQAHPVVNNDVSTDGWTWYEGKTAPMPANVGTTGNILCYIHKGGTGRVRFDDFVLEPLGVEWIEYLVSSAYHNEASAEDGDIRFVARLHVNEVKCPVADIEAKLVFAAADGASREVASRVLTVDRAEFVVPAGELAVGEQQVRIVLSRRGGERLAEGATRFFRTEKPIARKVAFDRQGRVTVNGRRIFPLGMYGREMSDEQLDHYCQAPFNFLIQYGALTTNALMRYAARGIYVATDVRGYINGYNYGTACKVKSLDESRAEFRRLVGTLGTYPALLAWYLVDEAPRQFHRTIIDAKRYLDTIDPDHPAYVVTDKPADVGALLPAFDVIGVDPYPIGNFWRAEDFSICAGWVDQARAGSYGMRPMWTNPQAFDWEWFRKDMSKTADTRMPSRGELANMCWQSIAAGANGLGMYSYSALMNNLKGAELNRAWRNVCSVGWEIKALEDVLLDDALPLPEGMSGDVAVRGWRHGDRNWYLIVNRHNRAVKGVLPIAATGRVLKQAGEGVSLSEGGTLAYDFAPLGYAFVSVK